MKKRKEPSERQRSRFGKRGEYLVALQALLMTAFVLTPPRPAVPGLCQAPDTARVLIGSACWAAALYFATGGVWAIRRYLTPLPYPVESNRLVVNGPYRLIRHPLYTAIMLAFAGWTLFTASLPHAALTLASPLLFNIKAALEERWLTQLHPEYLAYAAKTGRFLPRLWRRSK